MIVAATLDSVAMSLIGLGPWRAVLDADRPPAFKARPPKERLALCSRALYRVDVKAA